jgi:hypothetical protein
MRALILVLITLNLALAAWSWHYDKLSIHDDISLAAEIPLPKVESYDESEDEAAPAGDAKKAAPKLKSPSRADASKSEESAESRPGQISQVSSAPPPAPKPTVPATAKAKPKEIMASQPAPAKAIPAFVPNEPAKVASLGSALVAKSPPQQAAGCIVYGPFDGSIEAAQLAQRLQLDGHAAELSERDERINQGRWVLFPVANTREAEALMAAFDREGITDFGLVRKSPLGMAVSAGLYAGERSLKARLDSLMSAGFTPEVDNLYRDRSFYQVTVEEPPANPQSYGKFLACNA